MQLPGSSFLTEKGIIPKSVLLLTGPVGAGKSMYCRQFFVEGIYNGDYCIYLSSSLTEKQFRKQFSNIESTSLAQNSKFINPYLVKKSIRSKDSSVLYPPYVLKDGFSNESETNQNIDLLSFTLTEIEAIINNITNSDYLSSNSSIRVIVDSLTQLMVLSGEQAILKFINDLSFVLKDAEAMAIVTLTLPLNGTPNNTLSSIFDGMMEMQTEDRKGLLIRRIRLVSIKGMPHRPSWVHFKISDDGVLSFFDESSTLTCTLCGKAIIGTPILDSDFSFDSQTCMETYRKLAGVYGPTISETGLPSEVINVNFFFIDIVSLSDPWLPVKKQIEKIEILNKMIGSCETYLNTPKDKKIILPAGDGMAIGFLFNPESPLQLSIELHRKLQNYNRGKFDEDIMGVRIGLSSGPVFIVNDINNNQNVWGPGIVLARRVMDIGDSFHILLADRLAEELIELKNEYRTTIKYLTNYQIKHGQRIRLYSACSKEYGNPAPPSKLT
jgi:KaiC/GvpD/RAD55 family RecA-like ATPase